MIIRHLLVVALVACFVSTAAFAQTASVSGRVTDPQGGAVGGATVTVTVAGTGAATVQTATTAADGTYTVNLGPGTYVLQAEAPGFQTWVQSVVVLNAAQTVDVILPIGGIAESVVVAAPRLEEELPQEIERAGVRVQTITSAQIENGGYNTRALAGATAAI